MAFWNLSVTVGNLWVLLVECERPQRSRHLAHCSNRLE